MRIDASTLIAAQVNRTAPTRPGAQAANAARPEAEQSAKPASAVPDDFAPLNFAQSSLAPALTGQTAKPQFQALAPAMSAAMAFGPPSLPGTRLDIKV
jgi:hypothetical protein